MSKSLKPSLHLARLEYKINNESVEGTIAVESTGSCGPRHYDNMHCCMANCM